MGLFKKIIGGTNRNDVKVAKIELEKAKIDREVQKEKNENVVKRKTTPIDGYLEYSRMNFDRIQSIVLTLKNDIGNAVEKIRSAEKTKLSFKEKSNLRKFKDSCKLQLKYLYLSKDYLLYLSQYASGVDLNEEKVSLLIKFSSYFDGSPVIEVEENGDYDDDSIVGEFKSMFKEIGSAFYKPKSSNPATTPKFYLYEYIDKYCIEKIDKFMVPEVDSIFETFKKVVFSNTNTNITKEKVESSLDYVECSNCHGSVFSKSKFCPDCGSKIEAKKPMFCEDCGTALNSNSKFCPDCGRKV